MRTSTCTENEYFELQTCSLLATGDDAGFPALCFQERR